MTETSLTILISSIGVIISLIALIFTVRSFIAQQKLSVFIEYTKRYSDINHTFPVDISSDTFVLNDHKDKENILKNMRAYFELCSEEYYLKNEKGLINSSWEGWTKGMLLKFEKPAFKDAWEILKTEEIQYIPFVEFIERKT